MLTLKEIALAYFEAHPEAKREVIAKGKLHAEYVGPVAVAKIIRNEEERYLNLIKSAPRIIRKVLGTLNRVATINELVQLWDERGIDTETVCGILEQPCDTALIQEVRRIVRDKQDRAC